jgi:hypothetical protein
VTSIPREFMTDEESKTLRRVYVRGAVGAEAGRRHRRAGEHQTLTSKGMPSESTANPATVQMRMADASAMASCLSRKLLTGDAPLALEASSTSAGHASRGRSHRARNSSQSL